jgi:hypothetical protein
MYYERANNSHLSRRAALAAVGRCKPFEERRVSVDYLIRIPSSAERVACGTSSKATQQRAGWPILERFWQLSHGGGAWASSRAIHDA